MVFFGGWLSFFFSFLRERDVHSFESVSFLKKKAKEPLGWENKFSQCSAPGNLAFINAWS